MPEHDRLADDGHRADTRGVRDVAPSERPREKLLGRGASALADHELVAVLLGAGVRRRDVLAVAAQVLAAGGGPSGLATLAPARLMREPGVGPARAARLLAAVELGRRALAPRVTVRPRLATPAAVAAFLTPEHGRHRDEHFGVLLLDTKHRLLRVVPISHGTLDASLVHPREVFRAASEHSAAALVLFHNHPSGDPAPSVDDLQLTRRLVDAGELMGIAVVDHVVLGDGCWHSLRESSPGLFRR
jgi:DNA repair protein RadC